MSDDRSEESDQYLALRWSVESSVLDSTEPDHFVYESRGDILTIDDYCDSRSLAGRFGLYYLDINRALSAGTQPFDVFDSSVQIFDYYYHLYDRNSSYFSGRVMKLLNYEVWDSNILILDRIELLPQFRGQGHGLKVLRHMIDRFGAGAALVTIKPFPLQFEAVRSDPDKDKWRSQLKLDELTKSKPIGTKKLFDYYRQLGFRRIGRSPYMVLSTALPMS